MVSTPETRVALVPISGDAGATAYEARFDRLGFLAVMDRRCSWWNDTQTVLPPDYVLEHEQIHFALFEVEARRLDARSDEIMARARAVAATPAAAAAEVERAVKQELEAALHSALERNRAFDEETSFGHSPARQRRWRARVDRELTETLR